MIWRAARYRAGATRAPGHIWREYEPGEEIPAARVERALNEIGVAHYLPMEIEVRQHRRRKKTVEIKRRGLLPGYIFIPDPCDYAKVEGLSEILGFVRFGRELITIRETEIERIRKAEAAIRAKADLLIADIVSPDKSRREIAKELPAGTRAKLGEGHLLAGQDVEVQAVIGREYVAVMLLELQKTVKVSRHQLDLDVDAA